MAIIDKIEQTRMQGGTRGKASSVGSGADFNVMLDTISAMGPTAATAGQMYGSPNSAAVLGAAFSGIGATSAATGGMGGGGGMSMAGTSGAPYLAAGMGNMRAMSGMGDMGGGGVGGSSPVFGGTEGTGMSQMDMINTMNQNNLQLLELQAVMQNNMQGWNTKSNILSADHRARMAMIEKFTARG